MPDVSTLSSLDPPVCCSSMVYINLEPRLLKKILNQGKCASSGELSSFQSFQVLIVYY